LAAKVVVDLNSPLELHGKLTHVVSTLRTLTRPSD
jgi:hypothetical protein